TVLHKVSTRIASALDPDDVLASMLDSLGELLTYESAVVYLADLDVAVPAEGPHTVVPASGQPRMLAGRSRHVGALHACHGTVAPDRSPALHPLRTQQTGGRRTPGAGR